MTDYERWLRSGAETARWLKAPQLRATPAAAEERRIENAMAEIESDLACAEVQLAALMMPRRRAENELFEAAEPHTRADRGRLRYKVTYNR